MAASTRSMRSLFVGAAMAFSGIWVLTMEGHSDLHEATVFLQIEHPTLIAANKSIGGARSRWMVKDMLFGLLAWYEYSCTEGE